MDPDSYFTEVATETDAKLVSFNGPDRLSRLRSYYSTWRIPRHPESDQLHSLLCFLAEAQTHADLQIDLSPLDALFSLSVPNDDLPILEHCRRHYVILLAIQREIAAE